MGAQVEPALCGSARRTGCALWAAVLATSLLGLVAVSQAAWPPPSDSHQASLGKLERGRQGQASPSTPAAQGREYLFWGQAAPMERLQHHKGRRHRNRRSRAQQSVLEQPGMADRPLVATKKGLVRGITQKLVTGKFVDAFLGIPFAEPPVKRYRFRHPQSKRPWKGEHDASKMASSCYQVNDTFFGANFVGTSIWNANTPLSEDCLYLNVWSPFGLANTTTADAAPSSGQTKTGQAGAKRAVLVWIFGGGFYSGTSTLSVYEGGVMASEEDVVLVSMNYRVSSLGFLYFGRPNSPGNAGLFDQLMALQWINDNIDQFGGDPNRVTVFGESAGAVSIALHLLSPLSRNLFNQAILQSGAATAPWGFMEPAEIMANGLQLASLLKCAPPTMNQTDVLNDQLDQVVECLTKADPAALVSQEIGRPSNVINFPFVPVVDGSFLLESPPESLAKSNFKPTRLMLGSNHDEGFSWLVYLPEFSHCPGNGLASTGSVADQTAGQVLPAPEQTSQATIESYDLLDPGRQQAPAGPMTQTQAKLELADSQRPKPQAQDSNSQDMNKPCKPNELPSLNRDKFLQLLKSDLNPYADHPIAKEAMVFEYTNWNSPHDSASNYDALDKIVGDYHFTCPVNDLAMRYAQTGNQVYMYYFRQRASVSPWPKWMGVIHGDEVSFVFGEPLDQVRFNYSAKEIELSRRMMKYWANFAKYGDPTRLAENASMVEKWPEYADKRQYFELHSDYIRVGRGPRAKQCAFWSHYLPNLINSYDQNQCPASANRRAPSVQQSPYQVRRPPADLPADFGLDGGSLAPVSSLQYRRHQQQQSGSPGVLANIPSSILISLTVIFVLTILGLLMYVKRSWSLDTFALNFFTSSASNAGHQQQQQQQHHRTNTSQVTNNSSASSGNDNRRRSSVSSD